jgi:hypothetical protein
MYEDIQGIFNSGESLLPLNSNYFVSPTLIGSEVQSYTPVEELGLRSLKTRF